ncbi:MAG: ParB/RepB/Spo0J family partition protein [Bacilli bacterium]|mgnify:CR=1 FL=1|nr:ParB/RepB/Spo0J family partition protein [Bacilli bacterium]
MPQTSRKALGTGLEQLFSSAAVDYNALEEQIVSTTPESDIIQIPVSEVRSNPYQPRKYFDEVALQELADSIKEHGILEPIIVKKAIKGYDLVAGERRTKAARLAGLEKIPAIVKDFSDEAMMEIALLENIQREDLSAIEEAQAFKNIMDKLNMTQDMVAKRFGKSRSYVTNLLGLLNLPKNVQDDVVSGSISMSHARVLSKFEDVDKVQEMANIIKTNKMSVHELEEISQAGDIEKKNKVKRVNVEISNRHKIYEATLREVIGAKVTISNGKITIPFATDADLDRILEILNIEIGE